MPERLSNLGYLAIGKQANPTTPIAGSIFVPLYDENVQTAGNLNKLDPIVGHKFATDRTLAGMRSHGGDLTVMAEANTTSHFLNALLTKGTTTGSNPATHPYTVSATEPISYTYDINLGNTVKRFWGVQLSELANDYNDTELRHKLKISALGSFNGREIASVTTNTITLKTDYSASPNKGLIANDLVRIYKESTGATLDTTVTSVDANGITVVLGTSAAAFAPGDMIHLRPATPAYNNLAPFTWDKTFFGFGATAAAALTNATQANQVRVEQGSAWTLSHSFESDEGAPRSGDRDPAALLRTLVDAQLSTKQFFDTPEDVRRFNALEKRACVVRHIAGSTNQYELRVTFNNIITDSPTPAIKTGEIVYSETEYAVNQDQTDGQAIAVTVINALAAV